MDSVTIHMKPRNTNNPTIEKTTELLTQTLLDVIHDTYDYTITSDTYETVSGTLIVDNVRSVNVSLSIKSTNNVNIMDHGAVFNDPTFDNKPILESVMADLSSTGGGTIYVPSNGDLYTSENIRMASGIKIVGDPTAGGISQPGATIKLMPTVTNFWCIFHMDNEQDIELRNIGIDSNIAERKAKNTIGDLAILPQIAVSTSNDSKNITIENCYFHTNGVWVFASHTGGTHPRNLKVNNNHIKWTMGYATPDKPFVQGVTVDNTIIYFDAIDYECIGNIIETDTGMANMTGIEAHGANGVVRGNKLTNVRTGIIPWNMVNKELDIENKIIIEDNEFIDVLNGMDIGLTPGQDYSDLQIRRNTIVLNPSAFPGAVFSRGIILGVWNATNGELSKKFTIENNDISSKAFTLQNPDPSAYYNYYGIGIGSGVYSNLNIRNNTIEDMPSFGIMIQNEYQKTINIQSGLIEGNTIKNVAKSQVNRTSLEVTAIHVATRSDTGTTGLTVGVNNIIDTRSTTQTWYTKPTSMPTGTRFHAQNITESKLPPQGDIVFDSAVTAVDFTKNPANPYLESVDIPLSGNTAYILETNFPGDIWVTSSIFTPTQVKVTGGVSTPITTNISGGFGVVARPAVDLDGTKNTYNSSQLENKTYTFTIKKKI